MKEASGELNTTVVVVLAISVLIAFFYFTMWPLIKQNFTMHSQCSKAICETNDKDKDGYVNCHEKNADINCTSTPDKCFKCVYKG